MHDLPISVIVNAASGVLMVGLGLFVWLVRRREGTNAWFAAFAVTFGLAWVVDNLTIQSRHLIIPGRIAFGALLFTATICLVRFAVSYPVPASRLGRSGRIMVGVIGCSIATWWAIPATQIPLAPPENLPSAVVFRLGYAAFTTGAWAVLFLLPFGYREAKSADLRDRYALLSAGLLPYPAHLLGSAVVFTDPAPTLHLRFTLAVAVVLGYAVAWAWALHRAPAGRLVSWLPVLAGVFALAGMVLGLALDSSPGYGISRVLMVALISYAILRHQLLGIDVKVRWGISKTTLAAVFIAVFFIAGETAQEFFGETLGSNYVGILAAGALVFAIAPLSRFADRIAERAVPVAEGLPFSQQTSDETTRTLRAYRLAVLAALRDDGRITPREETHLADLAQTLGLGAGDALRIRRDVETAHSGTNVELSDREATRG